MRRHREEVESLGVRVIAVGTREASQAQRLIDDGMPFPLLMDPEDSVRRTLGIDAPFGWRRLLDPRGAIAYARSIRQARRFDPVWEQATQRPAVVLLDEDLELRWQHLGTRIGDYPTVDACLTAMRRLRPS